jgi:hypothetical protein
MQPTKRGRTQPTRRSAAKARFNRRQRIVKLQTIEEIKEAVS